MYNYFIYFEKREETLVSHVSKLKSGYVSVDNNGNHSLISNRLAVKPFTTESEARDLLTVLKKDISLVEYKFKILRSSVIVVKPEKTTVNA